MRRKGLSSLRTKMEMLRTIRPVTPQEMVAWPRRNCGACKALLC